MRQSNNNHIGLEITNEEIEKIEFRSEEVREILSAIPHWAIRSGSAYLLSLILLGLIISWFIKYPDIIKAQGTLTTKSPPISVITKSPGYVTLFVKDNEQIVSGQCLAYLSSTANVTDVQYLKEKLDSFKAVFFSNPGLLNNIGFSEKANLGEIQDAYNQFKKALIQYRFFINQRGNIQRSMPLKAQINSTNILSRQMQAENNIRLNELQLAKNSFERDSILYSEKVISGQEYEQKKKEYLANVRIYQNAVSGLTNRQIDRIQLQGRVADLQLEDQKQNDDFLRQIEILMNELISRIKQWEDLYLIKSPIPGRVALFSYWSDNQFVKSGEEIASIIPENKNYVIRAKVPVIGSGKIKIGQKVNIKLDSYPANEYGMLIGKVGTMSLIPKENNYNVLVEIPSELLTTFGKKIDFKQEMTGQAEIITEDMRLIERFFYNFRQLVNRR